MEKHPLHLKNPELQTSPEVERAVERQERQTGEKAPNDPAERIGAYTDRLENIFLNLDERVRERNLEMFRDKIYDALIIKRENFPESYFELQKRVARERGQAVEEIPANVREQMMDMAIEDQRASLDAWMGYLTSNDAVYPAWFKYFVWRSVTKLSQFDKERGEFKKRTDSTVAPFPDIYREPLAQIADIYEKVKEDNKNLKEPEIKEAFSKKFPALYAELIQKSLAAQIENKEEIRGQWVKYEQGRDGDAEKLFQSLEGKGTGWCTAGRSTAQTQIESGDFYAYYTNDSSGKPAQPRLAIRMDKNKRIAEVRGILPHQEMEPAMQEVLDAKLQEFGPEADAYRKKSEDMKKLTALEQMREKGEPFTKDDLVFLYEINTSIEGFGYKRDPRIQELRDQRDLKIDVSIIHECSPNQIATSEKSIDENTKVYVGQLFPGIFNLRHLEKIYTSFPERKIEVIRQLRIGDKEPSELMKALDQEDVFKRYSDFIETTAIDMVKGAEFTQEFKGPKDIDIAIVSRENLGFTASGKESPSMNEIYKRAISMGLDICPTETGPYLRLAYTKQPRGTVDIAMKLIKGSSGHIASYFKLASFESGLRLMGYTSKPWERGLAFDNFAFRINKDFSKNKIENRQALEVSIDYMLKLFERRYGQLGMEKYAIGSHLDRLDEMFGGLENLKGKKILDLGCGSTLPATVKELVATLQTSNDKNERREAENTLTQLRIPTELWYGIEPGKDIPRQFEPWFCRTVLALDAEAVGVDIGNLDGEQFEHHQADLTKQGSLDFLPDHSFDAINMQALLDSPTITHLSQEKRRQVQEELERQSQRLLKEGGRLLLWDVDY